jgi:hypothetical protein
MLAADLPFSTKAADSLIKDCARDAKQKHRDKKLRFYS